MPLWATLLINALVTGVILLAFAFFHHVLPAMVSEMERQEALTQTEAPAALEQTDAPATEPPATEFVAMTEVPTEAPMEIPTEPENRTEWQIKFAEHFSDTPVWTENSYKSPNVSITIETISRGEGSEKQTYHE